MEEGKKEIVLRRMEKAAAVIILAMMLGSFFFSRYLVSKLDGTGGVTAPIETSEESIHMLFVGDIMLDRTVRTTIENHGFDYIFGDIKSIFEGVDIAAGNLEGTITENASKSVVDHDILRFTFATSTALDLTKLGFTVFSLANNHALDFGEFGLEDTEHYLQMAGLNFFGSPFNERNFVSMPVINGQKICFIGFHPLFNPSAERTMAELEKSNSFCDYTIIFAHWGAEYETVQNKAQEDFAHAFIDAGADLVIGAHPHVVQPIEIYKNKAIFYSLGNFIFDQDFSLATRQGLAVRLELGDTEQKFHLIGIEMLKNKLYFPEKEAYKPSMDVLISLLPAELKETADVDSEFVLPR